MRDNRSLHIGIFPNHLTAVLGGSERLAVALANSLLERGHRISFFCNGFYGKKPALPLDSAIDLHFFNCLDDSNRSVQAARRELLDAGLDVFISLHNLKFQLFFACALMGTGIPYIYSELSAPSLIEDLWNRAGRLAAMSGADFIHMLLPEYRESLPVHFQSHVRIIPATAPRHAPDTLPPLCQREKVIVSLGGLNDNKQVDILVRAFDSVASRFPDWQLKIWGVGPCATKLDALISQSSACSRILRLGFAPNALQALQSGQIYCIPSRSEGMPMTLLEAMSSGLPAVGFAACPGVNSLIQHGENGLLAPEMTVKSLAEQLAELMDDAQKREHMGCKAINLVQTYQPEGVFDQWEQLIIEAAERKGHAVMDSFQKEPFASRATLSAAARREYLFRDFGLPMPGSWLYYKARLATLIQRLIHWKWFKK